MKRKIALSILMAALLLVGVMAVFAAYPVSQRGIEPVFFNDGPGGNVECDQVGNYEFASPRFDNGAQLGGSYGPFTWSTTPDEKFVSWEGVHGGLAVILKGGPGAHVYYYDASYEWDKELASPLNPGGKIPELSNITFCWNPPVDDDPGQWCSPGYWRQPHHLDSWEATGISPDTKYSAVISSPVITLSKKALKDGATADPTLWQVLQAPQWYGGAAFNAVGDLLSDAHPDVDFKGERVENSCPLN